MASWFTFFLKGVSAFLLIVPVSGEEKTAQWNAYTERVVVSCMDSEQTENIAQQLTQLQSCVQWQQYHLQCIPDYRTLHTRALVKKVRSLPCGWVNFKKNRHKQNSIKWRIYVFGQFRVNLTFISFQFPNPVGRCTQTTSPEHLKIIPIQNKDLEENIFCGRRLPFNLIWFDIKLEILYESIVRQQSKSTHTLHYEVCDQSCRTAPVNEMRLLRGWQAQWIRLSNVPLMPVVMSLAEYYFHITSDKLATFRLWFKQIPSSGISVEAFEGPGPKEVHRHRDEASLITGGSITFITFQCYVRVQCANKTAVLYYEAHALREEFIPQHNIEKDSIYRVTDLPSTLPLDDHLIYHDILLYTNPGSYLQVDLEDVYFHGPDYPHDYGNTDSCLLAGVTILDAFSTYSSYFYSANLVTDGNLTNKELFMNNIFPDITTCSATY